MSCLEQSVNLALSSAQRFFAAAKRARVHVSILFTTVGFDTSDDEDAAGVCANVGACADTMPASPTAAASSQDRTSFMCVSLGAAQTIFEMLGSQFGIEQYPIIDQPLASLICVNGA